MFHERRMKHNYKNVCKFIRQYHIRDISTIITFYTITLSGKHIGVYCYPVNKNLVKIDIMNVLYFNLIYVF